MEFSGFYLREINFGLLKPPKTAILTTLVAVDFEFWGIFDTFKWEIVKNQNSKPPKLAVFGPSENSEINFT